MVAKSLGQAAKFRSLPLNLGKGSYDGITRGRLRPATAPATDDLPESRLRRRMVGDFSPVSAIFGEAGYDDVSTEC